MDRSQDCPFTEFLQRKNARLSGCNQEKTFCIHQAHTAVWGALHIRSVFVNSIRIQDSVVLMVFLVKFYIFTRKHLDINNIFHKDFDLFRNILTLISVANVYIIIYPTSPQQAWELGEMWGSWVKTKYIDLHYKQGDRITNIT